MLRSSWREASPGAPIPNIIEGAEDSFIVQLFAGKIGRDLFIWLAHHGVIEADSKGMPMAEGIRPVIRLKRAGTQTGSVQ